MVPAAAARPCQPDPTMGSHLWAPRSELVGQGRGVEREGGTTREEAEQTELNCGVVGVEGGFKGGDGGGGDEGEDDVG